jgi:NADH/NAD ratio-sensing transcriptional regulator Rex
MRTQFIPIFSEAAKIDSLLILTGEVAGNMQTLKLCLCRYRNNEKKRKSSGLSKALRVSAFTIRQDLRFMIKLTELRVKGPS